MTILSMYVRNYFQYFNPETIIHVYNDIDTSTINRFRHNLEHRSIFRDRLTTHIFIKRIMIADKNNFVYDTFINPQDLLSVLTVDVIPFNHRIMILYINENKILDSGYLIGNEFVVSNTINYCNQLIQQLFRHIVSWLNKTYNSKYIVNVFNEHKIVNLLQKDPEIDERHIDTYYEEFVICNVMIDMIRNPSKCVEIGYSLIELLNALSNNKGIDIPTDMKNGVSGLITDDVLKMIMNLNKFKYSLTSIDDVTSVDVSKVNLKEYILNEH